MCTEHKQEKLNLSIKFIISAIMFLSVRKILVLVSGFSIFESCGLTEAALPFGIFPLLTSGWYYKPSPVESVVLGLIVVKVLALRLASITGVLPIPYHLNDLFVRSLGKRSIDQYFDLGNLTFPQSPSMSQAQVLRNISHVNANHGHLRKAMNLTSHELEAMYRVLLGVRRIDTSNCFLKTLCFISERIKTGKGSLEDGHLIDSMRYLIYTEKAVFNKRDPDRSPVMDVFEKALLTGMRDAVLSAESCSSLYSACPLTKKEMRYESIVAEFF